MMASSEGFWELNLSDGSAWFSDWFSTRLEWSMPGRRPAAFSDLRPFLRPESWDHLLALLRAHLERHAPLEAELHVQLADGREQRWHWRGAARRNEVGHPTHCAGTVRDITPDAPR